MRTPLLALGLCLLLAGVARADGAAPAAPGAERAQTGFQDFARQWMSKLRGLEERRPRVAAGPGSLVFTYRGYADEFRTEVQATGERGTPWVGLLHYTERTYTCPSLEARECTVAAIQPVTEIFRMRGGRWSY
jgi:hypothetical protein